MDRNDLKDSDLLLRLRDTEDQFVERKPFSDSKDWLKTTVAFANSTPIDYPAVLFIGVRDDGSPDKAHRSTTEPFVPYDLDSIQESFSEKVNKAYPYIYRFSKVLRVDDTEVLAIVIPGSAKRPHFAGPSYVREGSKSVEASDRQFETLIAGRNSKAHQILKWKGKPITLVEVYPALPGPVEWPALPGPIVNQSERVVVDCDQFCVTLEEDPARRVSFPLERVGISRDNEKGRLQLEHRFLTL